MSASISRSHELTTGVRGTPESCLDSRRAALTATLAQICIGGLIVISILVPPISLFEGFPYAKAEQLLLPVIIAAYVWLLLAGYARVIRLNGLMVFAVLFSASILFSLWYGSAILGHAVVLPDYYEIPKAWLPAMFFTLAYEADLSEISLRRIVKAYGAAVSFVCLYAWAQFANLSFTYRINPYYTGSGHIERALEYAGRVYSTMGNPNVLGQLLAWSIIAFSMAAIYRVGNFARNIGLTFVCLITLVMTGSRLGLVISALGLLMILILPSASRSRRKLQMGLLLLLLPAFAWTFQAVASLDRPVLERYETLRHPFEVDSYRSRVDDLWRDAADDFVRSPIFGNGPAKVIYTGLVTDSEYLDVLKEFGILGFLSYLGFYIYPLFLMGRSVRPTGADLEDAIPAHFLVMRFGVIMVVTALVMNIAMTTFYNEVLQAFLWIWMGLAAQSATSIRTFARTNLAGSRYGNLE